MLVDFVKNLELDQIRKEVQKMLSNNVSPHVIQKQLLTGLYEIGKKYENGEYYIGDLIISGMIMKEILSLDKMKEYLNDIEKIYTGKVVIGTVAGDIHDIGKDIMSELLNASGFEVLDLGVDVPAKKFVQAIADFRPDIVGISCIITSCVNNIFLTIKAIRDAGLRENLKIIVGGTALSKKYFTIKDADEFTNDAYEGLKICESWMIDKKIEIGAIVMATTLYMTVVNKLKRKIITGELKPGDMLKSETELMKDYGVSRMTLRKSLSLLSNEGYIYSVPGKGNYVRQPDIDTYQFRFSEINNLVMQMDDLKLSSVTIEDTRNSGLESLFPQSEQVVRIDRLVFCNEQIIGLAVVYAPYVPNQPVVEDKLNFANYSKALETQFAFSIKKEVNIIIAKPEKDIAKKLELGPNDDVVRISKKSINKQNNALLSLNILYLRKQNFLITATTPENDDTKKIF